MAVRKRGQGLQRQNSDLFLITADVPWHAEILEKVMYTCNTEIPGVTEFFMRHDSLCTFLLGWCVHTYFSGRSYFVVKKSRRIGLNMITWQLSRHDLFTFPALLTLSDGNDRSLVASNAKFDVWFSEKGVGQTIEFVVIWDVMMLTGRPCNDWPILNHKALTLYCLWECNVTVDGF